MVVSSIPIGGLYWMGDRLQAGIPPRYVTSHQGQLSLLPYVGRDMSTGQSARMRCGWGSKARPGNFVSNFCVCFRKNNPLW